MGLLAKVERTREMTTEEKVDYLLNGSVKTMVVVADHDEMETIKERLADERCDSPRTRRIDGDLTLQRGEQKADVSEEQKRRFREAMGGPQNDPTDQPDDWI